jgi:hypothetical protein
MTDTDKQPSLLGRALAFVRRRIADELVAIAMAGPAAYLSNIHRRVMAWARAQKSGLIVGAMLVRRMKPLSPRGEP